MRLSISLLLASLLLISVHGSPQETQTTQFQPPVTKDPQAIAIVNQALNAAGGTSAIRAITDYTASGTVSYHVPNELSGPVTIRESGLTQLRMDAQLPGGSRSQAMNDGEIRISEGGVTSTTLEPPPFYPGRIVLPHLYLAAASIGYQFGLSYGGTVELDGSSVHDIKVQRVVPNPEMVRYNEGLTMHFFIDASTFQVVMMQDANPRHEVRQIRYSDYRPVNGALVPFALSEQIEAHPTWTIQLTQINFNAGLQDSDFML